MYIYIACIFDLKNFFILRDHDKSNVGGDIHHFESFGGAVSKPDIRRIRTLGCEDETVCQLR